MLKRQVCILLVCWEEPILEPQKKWTFVCVCVSLIILIEVGLGYGEEGAVSVSSDSEDKGLPCENSKVTHHLPWAGDKEQGILLTVYRTLVYMEQPWDDKRHTHIL